MHMDVSIVTLTIILPHFFDLMWQPASCYSGFSVYLSFLFICIPSYNIYELQPTVAANLA